MKKKPEISIDRNKEKILFFMEENGILKKSNFIDYKKFISTILLKSKLSQNDNDVISFLSKIKETLNNYLPLVLKNIVIDFELNNKFSFDKKVPFILETNDKIESNNQFEKTFNEELNHLIKANYYVEFLPNLILYFSSNSQNLRIYVKKSYFN
ncbi:MSC_0623 family F1-like ATPase-associated protein [Metamycoplasma auris]|uniref:Uncharacterized protein DUF2714 n=1 Tax=Metamycoplasma auris TaxID=51363 RepID=A0A2W7GV75_9BACT|nr:DUF2714 domain-containing protein [Metamycoplasma auris]PZW01593.1 uncharacterized protein DUF2714 [Metamycoplasma auris]